MAQINGINNRSSTLTVDNTLTITAGGATVTAGDVTVTAGNVKLPTTTATTGQVQINATRFLHNFGTNSTFVGSTAGNLTNTGTENTGLGTAALTAVTSSTFNTGVGHGALTAVTSGTGGNTAVGYTAGVNVVTGVNNTAVGMQALVAAATSASYNTAIGYQAGASATGTSSSNIYIMNTGAAESNKMRIGTDGTGNGQVDTVVLAGTNASISTAATAGTVNIATGAAAKTVTIGSTNTTSSLALKTGTSDFSLASATGTLMSVLDTGETTFPLQSAFLAYMSATRTDVTGDNTVYKVAFDSEVFDQNSDFDTGAFTFTAPVTGRYFFNANIWFQGLAAANNVAYIQLLTSNRSFYTYSVSLGAMRESANQVAVPVVFFTDMDAADTAYINISVGGATKVVDILANGATDPRTWFAGYLVC